MEFAPDVHKLYRLDRMTGSAVQVDLDNRVLRTTLPGGTGDLYRWTDKPFPGT